MPLTTKQKLGLGIVTAALGGYAYYKFAEAHPFGAGVLLGFVGAIFGPAFLEWSAEIGRRAKLAKPA